VAAGHGSQAYDADEGMGRFHDDVAVKGRWPRRKAPLAEPAGVGFEIVNGADAVVALEPDVDTQQVLR